MRTGLITRNAMIGGRANRMSMPRLPQLAAAIAIVTAAPAPAQEPVLAVGSTEGGVICPIERLNELYRNELAEQMADDPRALISIRSHVAQVCIQQQQLLAEVWRGDQQLRDRFGIREDEIAETAGETGDTPKDRILAALLEVITEGETIAPETENPEGAAPAPLTVPGTPGTDTVILPHDGAGDGNPEPAAIDVEMADTASLPRELAPDDGAPAVDPAVVESAGGDRPDDPDDAIWARIADMHMIASVRLPGGGWQVMVRTTGQDGQPQSWSLQPGDQIHGWMLVDAGPSEAEMSYHDGKKAILRPRRPSGLASW